MTCKQLGLFFTFVFLPLLGVAGCKRDSCVPGQSVACVGPSGCTGGQVCAAEGDHFGPCDCGGALSLPDAATPPADMALAGCAPSAECNAAVPRCVGLVNNAGQTSAGLRVHQLHFAQPLLFNQGILRTVLAGNILPNLAACNLHGAGWLSWLLQFDVGANMLRMGSGKPVSDPRAGYRFMNENITVNATSFLFAPRTVGTTADGATAVQTTTAVDLNLAWFLDSSGIMTTVLPLRQLRLRQTTLSADRSCVGSYNTAGLQPENACLPDDTHPSFVDGGQMEAYITLEDADLVDLASIGQSLCVALSGDAALYADNASPVRRCKRTAGKINFSGDWCKATDAAATTGCADAVRVTGSFAASSVKVEG